jgi:hypothetical protein
MTVTSEMARQVQQFVEYCASVRTCKQLYECAVVLGSVGYYYLVGIHLYIYTFSSYELLIRTKMFQILRDSNWLPL